MKFEQKNNYLLKEVYLNKLKKKKKRISYFIYDVFYHESFVERSNLLAQ